ncbi:hypothetical protein [Xylocopilactobacillus apis]|uniref:Uncharacterized protein n=1 Tax=Xylocopilactobacillus apis TaxID=2932183 RepID=A0AAU9DKG4_9LACO|nr:hypothetical protein [Xylocopilactobacillus apis]BDR57327.1 hypothetical protein KIMC2_18890 [Xylocopilactobacillus apis]
MDPNKINDDQTEEVKHYRRENRSRKSKVRSKDIKQNPLSPKIYVPLIIFGIIVVIYALWNPFSPPSLTIGGKEGKLSDFNKVNVTIKAASPYPEKSGGRQVKLTFTSSEIKEPIPVKDNITVISNHGALTFKTDDKYVDLSTGKDTITGTLYGIDIPNDHLGIQIFSDQQKLVKQTILKPVVFPMLIKNLYLQGTYQKSSKGPKMEIGIYLKSNTRYEDNVLWNEEDQEEKRNLSVLNTANGAVHTKIQNNAIYYSLKPDEVIQAAFYNDSLTKSQVITKLNRYVDGDTVPEKYRFEWEIEFKNNSYRLIYHDENGNRQKSPLKTAKTGNFESFSQARDIPDPAPPSTTVSPTDSSGASSTSSSSSSASQTSDKVQITPSPEVKNRVLALLIKHWPTQLNQSQIKLFSLTSDNNNGVNSGTITYTYMTNGQPNKIHVTDYQLKNDGTVNYKATSAYSPNDFSGNIFSDISNSDLSTYFGG